MKFRVLAFAVIALVGHLCAQTASVGPKTLTANTQCVSIPVGNAATVSILVSGTFSATIQPQVTLQGQAAVNTTVYPVGSTTSQNTITSTGAYVANVAGFTTFQVCTTAYVSGTATIWMNGTLAINASLFGGGGGGGTGTVTHTVGSLTANAMLSGNGLADIKVADANGVTYSMGAITTDIDPFALTWTTNNAATTFSGMKFIVTNTAFHSGSLNFQWCNGASGALCASIDTAANFLTVGNGTFGAGNTVAGIVAEGGGTQAPIATNSFTISTQGSSVMTGWNANFPAAAGNGVINWTNTSNQVNGAFTPLQGTDANILTSGTISTSAAQTLCTDANHGATTTGCSGGSAPAITILSKSATYAPVAGDFTNGCTEWIEYTLVAQGQTATLPSTAPTAGTCVVLKSLADPFYLQVLTGGATTLDGVAFASAPGYPVSAGTPMTVMSDGANYHSLGGQGPRVLTANKGGFYSLTEVPAGGISNQAMSGTSNQNIVAQFTTHAIYKISSLTFFLSVGAASGVCDVGLYDSSGNLLTHISSGATCTTAQNASQIKSTASSTLIIPPVTYFAAGCLSVEATMTMAVLPLASNGTQLQEFASTGTYGVATNPCVGGVLPATLGTVTNSASINGIPYFWMQP